MLNLDNLNPMQREAVEFTDGPVLILAGAGSGKTRVITYRIAHLITNLNVNPWNVLAVTFTNKAAQEMKERIFSLLNIRNKNLWVSTFHSLGVRILQNACESVGYKPNFVIYSSYEQEKIIKEILKKLNIDEKKIPPNQALSMISRAKNDFLTAEKYNEMFTDFFGKKIGEIYSLYQGILKKNNAMDFDDLIMLPIIALENNDFLRNELQERFKYILVDEYQDTNVTQYKLIRLLSAKYKNVCVVGDDDQSIYQWRGADIKNILYFERDFPNTKIIRLEENYRCTKTILSAANTVIENNKFRKGKKLWTTNSVGDKIIIFKAHDEIEESSFVAKQISSLVQTNEAAYRDFAIFYRTHAQSRTIEDSLRKERIPYVIVAGLKFYDRKEIKDILAYLKVIVNPLDNINLMRIINIPKRGIGDTTQDRIKSFAQENNLSMFDAMKNIDRIDDISPRLKETIKKFVDLIEKFIGLKDNLNASKIIDAIIIESGYQDELKLEDDAEVRIQNIMELISAASGYEETTGSMLLGDFLKDISLATDIDRFDNNADCVRLMTLHNAKGLEFPMVFMVGVEEGIFPHNSAKGNEKEMEEERRLCYVGITRSKQKLFITCAVKRRLYGQETFNSPSRFLREIPEELVKEHSFLTNSYYDGKKLEDEDDDDISPKYTKSVEPLRHRGTENNIKDQFAITEEKVSDEIIFKAGQNVYHKVWGKGKIKNVIGKDENAKIEVLFEKSGAKKLAIKYANLVRV